MFRWIKKQQLDRPSSIASKLLFLLYGAPDTIIRPAASPLRGRRCTPFSATAPCVAHPPASMQSYAAIAACCRSLA